jgi:hypothetical protein
VEKSARDGESFADGRRSLDFLPAGRQVLGMAIIILKFTIKKPDRLIGDFLRGPGQEKEKIIF